MKAEIEKDQKIHYDALFNSKFELGVRLQDKNMYFPEHKHDYVEIVVQIEGSSEHFIDQEQYILNKNEIIIINPQQTHINNPSDSTVLNLILSFKFLTNLVIESAFDPNVIKLKETILNSLFLKKIKMTDEQINFLTIIYHNIQNDADFYYLNQRLNISLFLLSLYKNNMLAGKVIPNSKLDLISYIQDNLQTASLNEYAQINHYSTSLLSQKIKSEYNMTFIEILHEIRLKVSIDLLQNSEHKIDDIIYEVGYQNRTHFYRLFKRRYNITPKQYRNLYSIKANNLVSS